MIAKLEITGIHTTVDEALEKYARRKIGQLDKYVSRHARPSLHVEIKLKEGKAKDKRRCLCEVVLFLPHETLTTSEATVNMYAAIDIVEAKLKQQLKKYKELHNATKLHRRLISHTRRS